MKKLKKRVKHQAGNYIKLFELAEVHNFRGTFVNTKIEIDRLRPRKCGKVMASKIFKFTEAL